MNTEEIKRFKDIKLLEESIRLWEQKKTPHRWTPTCPLCIEYAVAWHECTVCPIMEYTGKEACYGTPYYEWQECNRKRCLKDKTVPSQEEIECAEKEIDFLAKVLHKLEGIGMKKDDALKDVKKGDYVFTIKSGWTEVIDVVESKNYPLVVRGNAFTLEGKSVVDDAYPSCWTYNPFDEDDTAPPLEIVFGTIIAVRHDKSHEWKYGKFLSMFDNLYKIVNGSVDSYKFARRLTPSELHNDEKS